MNFDGIELDMLFARLALKEIPDNMVWHLFVGHIFKIYANKLFFY